MNARILVGGCSHFRVGPWAFDVEVVLDEWLGMAEALIRCQFCERRFLIDLIDWVVPALRVRRFGMRTVEDVAFERFVHDISRDYCDLGRKQAEADALRVASPLLDFVLTLDVNAAAVVAIEPRPPGLPTSSWRQRLL